MLLLIALSTPLRFITSSSSRQKYLFLLSLVTSSADALPQEYLRVLHSLVEILPVHGALPTQFVVVFTESPGRGVLAATVRNTRVPELFT
jgi:hypothetical protein